jgi:hypothetical protein
MTHQRTADEAQSGKISRIATGTMSSAAAPADASVRAEGTPSTHTSWAYARDEPVQAKIKNDLHRGQLMKGRV